MRPLPALILAAALAAGCSNGGEPERAKPEHVLLIVVDTLRADYLGCYGHYQPTPRVDSVAEAGVRFERAIVQGSWTAPSMVSIMIGRRLAEERLDVPAELPTLAESFQKAGWATGAFIMNDIVHEKQGFKRGFDAFEQREPYAWSTEEIASWVERNAGRKALTYVHLNEPHDPYRPPDAADHKWLKDPASVSDERRAFYREVQVNQQLKGDFDADVARIEHETAGYVDDVSYTDRRIGELLEAYANAGLAETTCVVITSDHGEGLWTRVAMMTGQRRKAQKEGQPPTLVNTLMPTHGNQVSYELVRVPLLMSGPGLPSGRVVRGPVELIDLFPTLLELCDLPRPDGLQGISLFDRIDGAPATRPAFSHTRFNSSLITPDGWQIIVPTALGECEEGSIVELYNLESDPECRENLAYKYPGRVMELTEQVVERWRTGVTISGLPDISEELRERLADMGYVDSGITELDDAELLAKPIAELVAMAADEGEECGNRWRAVRTLQRRVEEIEKAQLDALRALLDLPLPVAVKDAIGELLGD